MENVIRDEIYAELAAKFPLACRGICSHSQPFGLEDISVEILRESKIAACEARTLRASRNAAGSNTLRATCLYRCVKSRDMLDGILVQLTLPRRWMQGKFSSGGPGERCDGFHPLNAAVWSPAPHAVSLTPPVDELLRPQQYPLEGQMRRPAAANRR